MIHSHAHRSLFTALLFSTVALLACGKPKIDNTKLEATIKTGIEAQVKDAKVKSVTCPADQESKPGNSFTCDAVDEDGTKVNVFVSCKDDQGNVEWKMANVIPPPK